MAGRHWANATAEQVAQDQGQQRRAIPLPRSDARRTRYDSRTGTELPWCAKERTGHEWKSEPFGILRYPSVASGRANVTQLEAREKELSRLGHELLLESLKA